MPEAMIPVIATQDVERAVRLSYAQAMVGSIFAASTGGMFLIGYALQLGAQNVHIGLMSTIPMLCVVVQLLSSLLVERGVSRRKLTLTFALLNVFGWGLIILIPYLAAGKSLGVKMGALIGIITLVTLFGQVSGNARGSWVGDLIPERFRGTFFGRLTMYGGIIGTVFALIEGRFLDLVKSSGIGAFSWLFAAGMLFGLANALLFAPQVDVPLQRKSEKGQFTGYLRATFANGPLMVVMLYALLWSLQGIAGPFFATYMLRDLGMPFLGIGIVNSAVTLTMLFSSPFWGRVVDRYGCRPVLISCTAGIAPLSLIWLVATNARLVYWLIIPVNLLCGFLVAGVSVALNTLVYKITPSAGRSVQFAVYSIIVVLCAAPMPTIGGNLADFAQAHWPAIGLRATFFAAIPFITLASFAARFIKEPASRHTGELMRNLPNHLRKPATLRQE